VNNRDPMTANGIYQMIVRRGEECGVPVNPQSSGTTSRARGWTTAAAKATRWS
jgi:hypothetical protein